MAWLEQYRWLLIAFVVLTLTIVIVITTLAADTAETPAARQRRVLAVVFGTMAIAVLLLVQFVDGRERWIWLAAGLPTYFTIQYGINTAIFKNRYFFDGSQEPNYKLVEPRLLAVVKDSIAQERRYYSTASLLLRFVLPALAFMTATTALGYTLMYPPTFSGYVLDERFVTGAQLGALGAYLYVLLFLGGRTMRSDITPASIIWASVTMVGGPLLAGVLQLMFIGKADGAAEPAWNNLLLPFAAGFSLRVVVDFVDATIRRLFTQRVVNSRGESLLRIRGVTYEVEERLIEEGIADVSNLAMANPHRLRRNTRFDKRQIMSWIDEALLMLYLPNAWQSFEADGITGASDLAWYVDLVGGTALANIAGATSDKRTVDEAKFIKLAERNKLDPAALAEVVLRLASDRQVQLIWGLYQLDDASSDDDNSDFEQFAAENTEHAERTEPMPEGKALARFRNETYERNRNLFIVHTWRRSATKGQLADVVIRLTEHKGSLLATSNITRVAYYLGDYFGGNPIPKTNAADDFKLELSCYGSFLCVASIEFADNSAPIFLQRYIDFDVKGLAEPRAERPVAS